MSDTMLPMSANVPGAAPVLQDAQNALMLCMSCVVALDGRSSSEIEMGLKDLLALLEDGTFHVIDRIEETLQRASWVRSGVLLGVEDGEARAAAAEEIQRIADICGVFSRSSVGGPFVARYRVPGMPPELRQIEPSHVEGIYDEIWRRLKESEGYKPLEAARRQTEVAIARLVASENRARVAEELIRALDAAPTTPLVYAKFHEDRIAKLREELAGAQKA